MIMMLQPGNVDAARKKTLMVLIIPLLHCIIYMYTHTRPLSCHSYLLVSLLPPSLSTLSLRMYGSGYASFLPVKGGGW
jgi:hypothetical protein